MIERRWPFRSLFWRLTASYFVATLSAALITEYIARFSGPFGAFRDAPIVVFFNHIGDNSANSGLLFVFGASVIGLLTGALVSGNLTHRLRRITSAVDAWGRGEFTVVAHVTGSDELGALASDLNRMAGQIHDLFTTRQALAVVEERNRLARDLHDSVKQQVFANALLIRAARKRLAHDPATAIEHLAAAEALAEQTQQELIALIRALRPPALADKGLADMLRAYTGEWSQRMGVAVDLRLQGERETPLQIEDTLFRVAQETLANIAHHSDARHVNIALAWDDDSLRFTAQDDGKGFDTQRAANKGMGLANMRERVAAVNGRLVIHSSPEGTTIEACVPLGMGAPVYQAGAEEARDE